MGTQRWARCYARNREYISGEKVTKAIYWIRKRNKVHYYAFISLWFLPACLMLPFCKMVGMSSKNDAQTDSYLYSKLCRLIGYLWYSVNHHSGVVLAHCALPITHAAYLIEYCSVIKSNLKSAPFRAVPLYEKDMLVVTLFILRLFDWGFHAVVQGVSCTNLL